MSGVNLRRILAGINAASLDAPLVVGLWQSVFAKAYDTDLHWVFRVLVIGSVWLVYSADRWLDGWAKAPPYEESARHRFVRRYQRRLLGIWVGTLSVLVGMTVRYVSLEMFTRGLILLTATGLYFFLCHFPWSRRSWEPYKLPTVACVCAWGAVIFVYPSGLGIQFELVFPMALFALICLVNCLLLAHWEGQSPYPFKWLSISSRQAFIGVVVVTGVAAIWDGARAGGIIPQAVLLSLASLFLVYLTADQMPMDGRRSLVDFALLTPGPLLFVY